MRVMSKMFDGDAEDRGSHHGNGLQNRAMHDLLGKLGKH